MNQDTAAITPELDPLVPDAIDEVTTTQEQDQPALDAATQSLANLSGDAGWTNIATQMQAKIDGYKSGSLIDITGTDSLEMIGQKYMVARLVANELQQLLDQVTNAQQANIKKVSDGQGTV